MKSAKKIYKKIVNKLALINQHRISYLTYLTTMEKENSLCMSLKFGFSYKNIQGFQNAKYSSLERQVKNLKIVFENCNVTSM